MTDTTNKPLGHARLSEEIVMRAADAMRYWCSAKPDINDCWSVFGPGFHEYFPNEEAANEQMKLWNARAALAETLLDLATPPEPQADEVARLREAGQFLLDRLVDHEARMTSDEDGREWMGHVTPAMARFRQALGESQ